MTGRLIILFALLAASPAVHAAELTTLHSFTGGGDGAFPHAALVQGGYGNLYGTTSQGGTNGLGTAFRITPLGQFTTLWQFRGERDGSNPWGGLVFGSAGGLFGVAGQGGANGLGTVYKITARDRLVALWQFIDLGDGGGPFAALVQGRDRQFYGTTLGGPASIYGTVFKITPRGRMTPLWQFSGGDDGAIPWGALVETGDGNFYGATLGGGGGNGTLFRISRAGQLTPVHAFTGGIDGGGPVGLTLGADGNLYGVTGYGGEHGYGVMFKLAGNVLTPLHQFADGAPFAALTQGRDGNLYGTTTDGGTNGLGTIFMITPAGTLTTLHQFAGHDGAGPAAALLEGANGAWYGTTATGGAYDAGTVFRLEVIR